MSDTQTSGEDPWWRRGLLGGFNDAIYPSSVPEGAPYDLETARAARVGMLSTLGANLLAGAQRGLSPGERARFIAAAGEAPGQAQAILLRGGEQALNRRYREAQIGELQRRGQAGQALVRMLMGGDLSGFSAGGGEAGGGAAGGAAPPAGDRIAVPGAPDATTDRIALAESGGRPNAQNPNSSASGLFQITNGMWDTWAPQLNLRPEQRNDPAAQRQIFDAERGLLNRRLGRDAAPGEIYANWGLGRGGFDAFRQADRNADAYQVYAGVAPRIADRAFSTNPGLLERGMTVGQVLDRFAQRAAGGFARGVPGRPQTAAAPAPPAAPQPSTPETQAAARAALTPQQAALLTAGGPPPPNAAPANVVPASAPAGPAAPAPASAPLSPPQARLVAPPAAAPAAAAGRMPAGINGNTLAGMPMDLRRLAAARAASGDVDGAMQMVTQWLTRAPPQVQLRVIGGRVREILPNGDPGRDYGPESANDTTPMTEQQMLAQGVPAQTARMLSGLSRQEQEQGIRALASRETTPNSEQEDRLRTQFQALAPVVRYNQSVSLFSSVTQTLDRIRAQQAAGAPDRLAELDAVVALANLFDPGSVVREGEVANVQRTQDIPSRILGWLGQVSGGQSLGPGILNQMEAAATDRMRSYRRSVDSYARSYMALARRRGLEAANVVLDLEDPVAIREAERRNAPPPPGPNGDDARSAQDQRRLRRPDGFTPEQVADRIRQREQDPARRRALAVGAGIDPRLVE